MSQNPGAAGKPGATYDPFAAWKSFYQMNEDAWTQMLEQMMGTQAFASAMGQWLDNNLKAQEVAKKNAEASLNALNFPTKSEITRLAEQIVTLDAKVDDLLFALERVGDDVQALKERGPEGIRSELEALGQRVAELSDAAGKARTAKPATSRAKSDESTTA